MRFRSLESRIVTLFLVLIVVVQVLGLLVIQQGIASNARSAISAELGTGAKVFRRLLEQNAQKLRFGASVLARDTAFVQAIGNDDESDRATIESALANSGRRIKASLTMLVGAERTIKASTNAAQSAGLEQLVVSMLDKAEQYDGASGIAIVERRPYQIVVVPVRAPIIIGYVVMAFPIDRQLANDMRDISSLQVAVLTRDEGGDWLATATTLPVTSVGPALARIQALPAAPLSAQLDSDAVVDLELDVEGSHYSARLLPIGQDGARVASVVLARSIDEAMAEYTSLRRLLLALSVAGIGVAALASVLTAKRIAQPLSALAATAKRLEQGDYKGQLDIKRDDQIGALAQAFESMRDGIAKREQEIRRLAYWDSLTGLPNRAQFVLLLDDSIEQAGRRDEQVFVLMMDLDRFKHVNDVMGHSFGDALLRQVAERLQLQLAQDRHGAAQVARLGGDEFAILLPNASLEQARLTAAQVLAALESPLSLEDQMVDIGAGLGIAGYPSHADTGEALLSMAEVAMYAAKQRNDGAVVYQAGLDKASEQSLSLLTELRNAIEGEQFRLHVQPKIMLGSGDVVGVEALVRWQHPERGNVFPDDFIPFAEQSGFIRVLTRWVLEKSAALCQQLAAEGVHLKVSVNLSTRDLLDQNLPVKFAEILARYRLQPSSFCLEITESAIMDDPVRAQLTLERLHAMGVDLSIDDFGTGYSSLAYLKRLPVDELKIDKSFVLNMEHDEGDTKIVRSTIDLGHNMGLRVVAEGIESEAVWRLLAEMGCDQGQGYFMSRPMPGEQLLAWLATWRARAPATTTPQRRSSD
ncbi:MULTISPECIES: putative bifunctional diguanylate cyclase/phosphodiesterase [unclassified Janthinobacterium]|uniref:putative bifunctional diguanylate cyclase/phosphodiesterase n=1 Tax=unclassified Janthinobacterium TaxID=2610881 RepID=UPI000344CA87|nr:MULTISPECIES: EAL domain-containing protein [unclassified Janthinobacterium]MEC5160736.1 diguanylate cyclase (GGDEF)-like protein [Janthinobacterium sp. CG_S6]